ncbi:hypothetical protein HPB49_022393 [Dermacentor silvarum]|uniref:Uncharacterized protein n=1 Tax=Dermacentor silvarum TaxID=543639 RepID=A0ACB8D0I5_DERSI|nr:hypothetical protein HPB49_022393 [Dermacentor silvarum]
MDARAVEVKTAAVAAACCARNQTSSMQRALNLPGLYYAASSSSFASVAMGPGLLGTGAGKHGSPRRPHDALPGDLIRIGARRGRPREHPGERLPHRALRTRAVHSAVVTGVRGRVPLHRTVQRQPSVDVRGPRAHQLLLWPRLARGSRVCGRDQPTARSRPPGLQRPVEHHAGSAGRFRGQQAARLAGARSAVYRVPRAHGCRYAFAVESPRWLVTHDRRDKALDALRFLYGPKFCAEAERLTNEASLLRQPAAV